MLPAGQTLIAVRHGETDWNAVARLQGTQDIPLNDRGRRQARANGRALAAWFDRTGTARNGFDYVASPLDRARETMALMRSELELPPDQYGIDAELRELTFGRWEGMTLKQVKAADPAGHAARKADRWGFVPPDGESYAMLADRVALWLADVDRDMVVATHGGVVRALLKLIRGDDPAEIASFPIHQDRFVVFRDGVAEWIAGIDA